MGSCRSRLYPGGCRNIRHYLTALLVLNRHAAVDMKTKIEAAQQLTYYTAWRYGQGEYVVMECSMAKLLTTELAKKVADSCLQFFGGYGYMDEYPISRMFRDARAGTIVGGTSEIIAFS